MLKTCPFCHKDYETKSLRRRFCGDLCQRRFHNRQRQIPMNLPVACRVCGVDFFRTHGSQRICSDECKRRLVCERSARYKAERRAAGKETKDIAPHEIKDCDFCEDVAWMYQNGETTDKMAERLGYTLHTFRTYLARHGMKDRPGFENVSNRMSYVP